MKTVCPCLIASMILAISLLGTANIVYAEQIVNLLVNSYFAEGIVGWNLECQDPFARANIEADSKTKVIDDYSLKVENLPKAPPPKGQMGLFIEEPD